MTGPRPHAPWCARQGVSHPTCYSLVAAIDVTPGIRVLIELNRSNGVPTLISMAVDRSGRRSLLALTAPTADEIGAALTLAAQTARLS